MAEPRTGFVWDERFAWHDIGAGAGPLRAGGWVAPGEPHVDWPTPKRRIRELLDATGVLDQLLRIPARPATDEELQRFHAPDYVEKVRKLSGGEGGEIGLDAFVGRGGFEYAKLSAGGGIEAVDAVLDGRVENCYALLRPIGHHVVAEAGMGFGIFNNIVIAAKHAREAKGTGRIAVLDWDVHHGNGTQSAFYDDPTVLTISVHQDNVFPPDSGHLPDNGEGDGEGFNLNIPLPPGSGRGAYDAVFERVVEPALRAFQPELMFVGSGFDANGMDPLSRQLLYPTYYGEMADRVLTIAAEYAGGNLVLFQEGGYSPGIVPFCGLRVIERISGIDSGVEDPYSPLLASMGGQDLQTHQDAVITEAESLVGKISPTEVKG